MNKYCSAKSPGGPDRGSVTTILLGKYVIRCFLLINGRYLKILPFLGFHAKANPTIKVKMFIMLGKYYDACESDIVLK